MRAQDLLLVVAVAGRVELIELGRALFIHNICVYVCVYIYVYMYICIHILTYLLT